MYMGRSLQVYLSLLPIMCGVMIATLTELSFHYLGFLSALVSTFAYALLNTFVKKVAFLYSDDSCVHSYYNASLSSYRYCKIRVSII